MAIVILTASILLQLTAAFLALRLIGVTGRRAAWILIAAAIALMAVRRTLTLFRVVFQDVSYPPDLPAELVALVISAFMVAGIAGIRPLFRATQQSQTKLRESGEQLREALAWQEAVFEGSRDAILISDAESRFVDVNQAACELTGYTRAELLDMRIPDIHADVDLHAYKKYHARIMAGEDVVSEAKILTKDGRKVPAEFNNRRILISGVPYMHTVARDITTRVQAEESLQHYVQRLKTLHEIDRALLQARSLDDIVQAALERIRDVVSSPRANVTLFDFEADELTVLARLTDSEFWLQPGTRSSFRELIGSGVELLQQGEPIIVQDTAPFLSGSPPIAGILQETGVRSLLVAPLVSQNEVIGSLNLAADHPDAFDSNDVEIAEELADHLTLAIKQPHLFTETQEALARERHLTDIARTLSSSLDPSIVLTNVVHLAAKLVDADAGALALVDPDGEAITYHHLFNLPDALSLQASSKGEGLAWHIVDTGKSVLIPEYSQHHEALPQWVAAGVHALIGVPVITGEQRIGALGLFSLTPDKHFSQGQLALLEGVGQQAGIAIQNARLHQQTERRLHHLDALRQIDMAITASLDLRVTLSVILDQTTAQLGVDAADVLLLNPHTQTLEYTVGRGFHTDALQHTLLRLGEGYAGRAAREQRLVSIPNLAEIEDSLKRSPHLPEEGFVSYYAVPLVAKGQVQGVLEIFHRESLDPNQEWLDFLEALGAQAAIAIDNARLFDDLQRSNTELRLAYNTTLEGWARALELRDMETEGHSRRVTEMTIRLGRATGLSDEKLVHVRRGALLHDIGKIGIPDSILLKPDELTDEEWEVIRQHPVYAHQLLSPIPFLQPALDIPYCHHERWDGTGYPRGLKGEEIPPAARIFAVVDVYDALRSERPYREAWSEEEAIEYIREQAGRHFDPQVVAMFFEVLEIGDWRLEHST